MAPTPETRRITVELDPETWARIRVLARLDGRTPANWISETVQDRTRPGRALARDLGPILIAATLVLGVWTAIAAGWFLP